MAFAIEPIVGTTYIIVQDELPIARVYHDGHEGAWIVVADSDRFPSKSDLPPSFNGWRTHSLPDFEAVERFFGCSEPTEAEADAALIQAAHRRGADLLDAAA